MDAFKTVYAIAVTSGLFLAGVLLYAGPLCVCEGDRDRLVNGTCRGTNGTEYSPSCEYGSFSVYGVMFILGFLYVLAASIPWMVWYMYRFFYVKDE